MEKPPINRPVELGQERDIEQRLQKARSSGNPLIVWAIFIAALIIIAAILLYYYCKGVNLI
jgi:hypothetical protein